MYKKTKKTGVNFYIFISLALIVIQLLMFVVPIISVSSPIQVGEEKASLSDQELYPLWQGMFQIIEWLNTANEFRPDNQQIYAPVVWMSLGNVSGIIGFVLLIVTSIYIAIVRKKKKDFAKLARASAIFTFLLQVFYGFSLFTIHNYISKANSKSEEVFGAAFANADAIAPTVFFWIFFAISIVNILFVITKADNFAYKVEEYTPGYGQDKYIPGMNSAVAALSEENEFAKIAQIIETSIDYDSLDVK